MKRASRRRRSRVLRSAFSSHNSKKKAGSPPTVSPNHRKQVEPANNSVAAGSQTGKGPALFLALFLVILRCNVFNNGRSSPSRPGRCSSVWLSRAIDRRGRRRPGNDGQRGRDRQVACPGASSPAGSDGVHQLFLTDQSVRELLRLLDHSLAIRVKQLPDAAAACRCELPEFPIVALAAVSDKVQHLLRVGAGKPLLLGHWHAPHFLPVNKSTTQQPRTCGVAPRQWVRISVSVQPASSKASASTGNRSKARSS